MGLTRISTDYTARLNSLNHTFMHKIAIHWPRFLLVLVPALALAGGIQAGSAAAAKPKGSSPNLRATSERTALDEYVAAPDTNYCFHVVKTVPGADQTTFILDMTSQAYLTTNEVDRPIWTHWMIVVVPKEVTTTKGFLFISGGNNESPPPNSADENMG